ncbi:Transposon Ty3-I Gag-Pol polyprotein [Ceratobasidium sp. AG-Ba]|nr:Transposon Ty3-I Gag-Pol polyprotein [Ceratobasidium sp. AG-Ba]
MGSMIRQCIQGKQNAWARHLPGIEYAINACRSESTGYSPFELNCGRVPPPITWNTQSEFSGVRRFLAKQKEAIIAAHNAKIAVRVRQIEQANKHCRAADFKPGDLVYLSMKNMRLPKRFARKLVPKFIGPHKIESEITKGTTYKIELASALKARGIRPTFHASLLRPHIPNDDRRFPGRSTEQVIIGIEDDSREWMVERVVEHAGQGCEAKFQLLWMSGDTTWESFENIHHLESLSTYLEAQGVKDAAELEWTKLEKDEESELEEEPENEMDNTEISVNAVELYSKMASERAEGNPERRYIVPRLHWQNHHEFDASPFHCGKYRAALLNYKVGLSGHPGTEHPEYQMYRKLLKSRATPAAICAPMPKIYPTTEDSIRRLKATQAEIRAALELSARARLAEIQDRLEPYPTFPRIEQAPILPPKTPIRSALAHLEVCKATPTQPRNWRPGTSTHEGLASRIGAARHAPYARTKDLGAHSQVQAKHTRGGWKKRAAIKAAEAKSKEVDSKERLDTELDNWSAERENGDREPTYQDEEPKRAREQSETPFSVSRLTLDGSCDEGGEANDHEGSPIRTYQQSE